MFFHMLVLSHMNVLPAGAQFVIKHCKMMHFFLDYGHEQWMLGEGD